MTDTDGPDKYNVSFITRDDAERCNTFYNDTYDRSRTAKQWRWEFAERTTSEILPFVCVENDNGEVLGTQAYIPIEMIDKNGVFPTGKSEETLLSPDLRGMGFFGRMYGALFERASEEGIEALWGFTPATRSFERIGFDCPGTVGQLLLPIRRSFVETLVDVHSTRKRRPLFSSGAGLLWTSLSRVRSIGTKPDGEIFPLHEMPDWCTPVTERFTRQWGGVTLRRSAEYLQWRLINNPLCNVEVFGIRISGVDVGYFAIAETDQILTLVDLMVAPHQVNKEEFARCSGNAVDCVLRWIRRETILRGLQGARAWHGSAHPFSNLVRSRAKRFGWLSLNRGSSAVLWRHPKSLDARVPADWNQWYVTRIFTEGHQG